MEDLAVSNPELIRQAVEEVLSSGVFARSDQLRNFLRYVCERTLTGRGKDISEYSVATEALGKPQDFSPGEDSSVRSRAYELRQKLQKYYELERPDAAIRIELPKGAYTPRFVERPAPLCAPAPEPEAVQPVPDPTANVNANRTLNRTVRILAAALAVSLLSLAAVSIIAFSRGSPGDSTLKEAWGPLAQPGADALVVTATSLHLDVRPYMTVVAGDLPKYPAPAELYPLYRRHRPLEAGVELFMHPVDSAVMMGHAQSLAILATELRLLGAECQILPERSITVPAMRERNVILIGNPQYSEAVSLALAETPLTVEFDPGVQDVVVRERGGARTIWAGKHDRENHYSEVFGLITVLPGEGEVRGPHRRLIFSGITSVGAHGAAEFFCRPEDLAWLRQKFGGRFPTAYQVVVRCRTNDTMLLASEYADLRVIAR